MSTKTLDRMKVSYFRTALDNGLKVDKREDGSGIIRGIPIFRAGTFKDSMGDPHTWETEHLQQMVFHFNMLREREVLPNIPVRDQHRSLFGSGGRVVGYLEGVRVEGEDSKGNPLLVADMDITEPDDFGRIERGTWRSRSAEVGFYETNDDVMYWPVLMGVAWVDLPAVEGLFGKKSDDTDGEYTPIHDHDEEGAVSHAKKEANKGGAGTATPPADNDGKEGQHSAPPATDKEGEGGEGNEEGAGEGTGEQAGDGSGDHSTPPAPSAGSTVTNQHSSGAQVHEFTLNGQTKTTDFAAVQAHIENLESVLDESRTQARKDFVSSLAESNCIAATQVESMQEHAVSLSDEQYEAFKKMYEDAPEIPLFSQHGQQTSTDPDNQGSEVETLRERVTMHKRSGMSEDKVKATESYRRLMELTDNKG